MLVHVMKRMSAVLGLLALTVTAPTFAGTPSRNQSTADAVASVLMSVPNLAGSPVQIKARGGVVTLTGQVSSPDLKAAAVANAQRVAGVERRDRPDPGDSRFPGSGGPLRRLRPRWRGTADDGRLRRHDDAGHGSDGAMMGGPPASRHGGPLPEGPAIPGARPRGSPASPNYAWPSYAPHPNFSAVGYPTVYPWQAWPNIGPFYPYPEVPLDWRAVTLRWDDGLWWLDFRKHYTRPFFTPYPFGLFGY